MVALVGWGTCLASRRKPLGSTQLLHTGVGTALALAERVGSALELGESEELLDPEEVSLLLPVGLDDCVAECVALGIAEALVLLEGVELTEPLLLVQELELGEADGEPDKVDEVLAEGVELVLGRDEGVGATLEEIDADGWIRTSGSKLPPGSDGEETAKCRTEPGCR